MSHFGADEMTDADYERGNDFGHFGDEHGLDKNGLDPLGHGDELHQPARGYDPDGHNEVRYDAEGYDADGFDENGLNSEGQGDDYDADGFDGNGYDLHGFDRDGLNEDGIDEDSEGGAWRSKATLETRTRMESFFRVHEDGAHLGELDDLVLSYSQGEWDPGVASVLYLYLYWLVSFHSLHLEPNHKVLGDVPISMSVPVY
jgi:hypothetical protein